MESDWAFLRRIAEENKELKGYERTWLRDIADRLEFSNNRISQPPIRKE